MQNSEQQNRQLREEFEKFYCEKLKMLKNFYEMKHTTLQQSIKNTYKKIINDDLLITMVSDRTTSNYIDERVKELFQQIVVNERQFIIEKLGQQVSDMKFSLTQTQRQYMLLKDKSDNGLKQTYNERITLEQTKNQHSETMNLKNREIYQLNLQLKQKNGILKELHKELQNFKEENQLLKQQLQRVNAEVSEAMQDSKVRFIAKNQQVQNHRTTVKALQEKLKEVETNFQQMSRIAQTRYERKKNEYKAKISEYKSKMTEMLRDRRVQTTSTKNQVINSGNISDLQHKMQLLVRENERRYTDLKLQKQKQKVLNKYNIQIQLQRKWQKKVQDLQNYYQKLLEHKIVEVQKNTEEYMQKIRTNESRIRQIVTKYQQEYLPKQEHERDLIERDKLITLIKDKIQELEQTVDDIHNKNTQLERQVQQDTLQIQLIDNKNKQYEMMYQQNMYKIKNQEQKLYTLKVSDKNNREARTHYEEENKSQKDTIESLKRANSRLQTEISEYIATIKQKDRKNKELIDEIEVLEKKNEKNTKKVNNLTLELEQADNVNQKYKKNLSQLEYKLKQSCHSYEFGKNQWQSKNSKIITELQHYKQQTQKWEEKYKQTQNDYYTLKMTNSELETVNRKIELQNKYYRETEQVVKQEQENVIRQLRKKISVIGQQLQESQVKVQKLSEQRKRQSKITERKEIETTSRIKQIKMSVKKVLQIIQNRINAYKKDIEGIKQQIISQKNILRNEMIIWHKTTVMYICQEIKKKSFEYLEEKNKIRENYEHAKSVAREELHQQTTKQQLSLRNQYNQEIKNIKLIIKQKQKQIQAFKNQIKLTTLELQETVEKCRQYQKNLSETKVKYENEKEECHRKIDEIVMEFKNEKEKLVSNYEDKLQQMGNQIQDLVKSIKNLKLEMLETKQLHDLDKVQLKVQLKSVSEQQKKIQEISYVKDQQINRVNEELKKLSYSQENLQKDAKQIWESDQKKSTIIHELEFKESHLSNQIKLVQNKLQRSLQQNSELRTKYRQKEDEAQQNLRTKIKYQAQLQELKAMMLKSNKNQDLRALQQMTLQTQQLSNKVNQMKKMSAYLDDKTPLRS